MTTPAGSQRPAYVRTGTPMAAGAVIVYIARKFGLELSDESALIVVPVVMYLYYVLGRAIEAYNPKLGVILGIAKQPAYSTEAAPAPAEGEHLEAVLVDEKGNEVGVTDDPPKDGIFRDWDGAQLDPEVIAQGEHLGYETPDIDFIEDEDGVKTL